MKMTKLADGKYLTSPTHGPVTATRYIEIKNGVVVINGWYFTQDDFFKVNILLMDLQH